jgi:hypothetical protein
MHDFNSREQCYFSKTKAEREKENVRMNAALLQFIISTIWLFYILYFLRYVISTTWFSMYVHTTCLSTTLFSTSKRSTQVKGLFTQKQILCTYMHRSTNTYSMLSEITWTIVSNLLSNRVTRCAGKKIVVFWQKLIPNRDCGKSSP